MPGKCRLPCRMTAAASWPLIFLAASAFGEPPESPPLTGAELRRQLDATVSWRTSASQPLRAALEGFCNSQRVAVFIDRRVDTSRKVEVNLAGLPLRKALDQAGEQSGIAVRMLGPVAYFGPEKKIADLRTAAELLREQVRELPPERRGALLRLRTLEWEALAAPREILEQVGRETGIAIENPELVPHDLWAAAKLPPLSVTDQWTLILAGFDLTVQLDEGGQTARIIPLEKPRLVRKYRAGANPGQVAAKLEEYLDQAEFRVAGGFLWVRGRLEDHERVTAALSGNPLKKTTHSKSKPKTGKTLITLTVKNQPLLPVLRQIAGQLKLKIDISETALREAGIDLDQVVSLEVTQATTDELLTALLSPAGLKFRREGNAVRILPGEK